MFYVLAIIVLLVLLVGVKVVNPRTILIFHIASRALGFVN